MSQITFTVPTADTVTAEVASSAAAERATSNTQYLSASLGSRTGAKAVGQGELFANVKDSPYNAVGDGVADDTTAVQGAINAVAAAGGGTVYFPAGIYSHTGLTGNASHLTFAGVGAGSQLSYTGTGVALDLGSKTSGSAVDSLAVYGLRITDSAATGTAGLRLTGVQFSRLERVRIDGFAASGAVGLLYDTQSVGSFQASINNVASNVYVTGCYNGVKLTKDAADVGTDGCNHNTFWGLRVAAFSGIGLDVDAGENNSFFGCDASTGNDGATGLRINDDVNSFFQIRTDNSFGVGNTATGIHITASGRDHTIVMPTGNGPTTQILRDDLTVPGMVLRHGFTAWTGEIRRSLAAIGADYAVTRAWTNAGGSNISSGELAYIDSTCTEGQLRRSDTTAGRRNLLVCVEQANASGGVGQFAERGSVVTVNVDATAVSVGDTLVQSTTANGRAMANNSVTDPALIVGVARTSHSSGANGNVKAYIR